MSRADDVWKADKVFDALQATPQWLRQADPMTKPTSRSAGLPGFEIEEALHSRRFGLDSWRFFQSNLRLYKSFAPSYAERIPVELAVFKEVFGVTAWEVFSYVDWCIENRSHLYDAEGDDLYMSLPYLCHLWVENTNARRLFFVYRIQTWIQALGLAGHPILDVGCGPAGTLRLLGRYNAPKIGIDISSRTIEWCQLTRFGNEDFLVMDCNALALENESSSVITSLDVLEHVKEPERALEELQRICRSGGLVAIVYPFGSDDWDCHISLLPDSELTQKLTRLGFRIIERATPPGEQPPCATLLLLTKA